MSKNGKNSSMSMEEALESAFEAGSEDAPTKEETLAATEATTEEVADTKTVSDPQDAEAATAQTPTVEEEDLLTPPVSWKSEYKEWFMDFQRANKEQAKYLVNLEKDMQRDYTAKTQKVAEERRNVQSIMSAMEPYQEELRLLGADPGTAITRLLAWNRRLATEPETALIELGATLGVDFQSILSQQHAQPSDPQVVALQRQLQELSSQVQSAGRERHNQTMAALQRDVTGFLSATDAKGAPKYPYVEQVADEMTMLAERLRVAHPDKSNQEILELAYNKAVRLNDHVWESLQLAESKRREAERIRKETEKAAAAKIAVKASPGNNSSAQASTVVSQAKSLDDVLNEAFANYK